MMNALEMNSPIEDYLNCRLESDQLYHQLQLNNTTQKNNLELRKINKKKTERMILRDMSWQYRDRDRILMYPVK